jgi:2-oxoglutarate ferredoxin oxidoreductase subunit delta
MFKNDINCLQKGELYMGKYTIKVQPKWCKSCSVCVAFCPKQVLVLDDAGKASVQNLEACVGCRLCEIRCSDYAIEVGGENGE